MGAGASFNFLGEQGEIKCSLPQEEIDKLSSSTHFTKEEIAALNAHFESISKTQRDDGLIDRKEFQTALGFLLKESLYVDRIFQIFDENSDGFISFDEFLRSVSILSTKGTHDEKMKFSFDILDTNKNGKLSNEEIVEMLKACISENSIGMKEEHLNMVVERTFEEADTDKDGFISLEEYSALAHKNKDMLSHMTINISRMIAEYIAMKRKQAAGC